MKTRLRRLLVLALLLAGAATIVAGILRHSGSGDVDLAARSVGISKPHPPALRAGGSASVEVEYAEVGGGALDGASAFEIVVFLSSDPQIGAGDIAVGRALIEGGLASRVSRRQLVSATIPRETEPGTFFLGAVVDAGGAVAEPGDDNNVTGPDGVMRVEVLPAALSAEDCDLFLGGAAWTGLCYDYKDQRFEAAPGARLYAEAQPINLGGRVPGTYDLAFYASKDATITRDDVLLGKATVTPAATSSAESAPKLSLTLPELEASTTYYVGAIVDSGDALREADESNNVSDSVKFTVVTREEADVDLSVPECELPDVVHLELGQAHHLPHAIAAFGSKNPGPFALAYFLDADGDGRVEAGGGDLEIGRKLFPGGLDLDSHPDAVGVGFAAVKVPTGAPAPGAYRGGGGGDPDNSVSERDETNNSCVSPGEVRVTAAETAPDLVVALTDADIYAFEGRIQARVGARFSIPFTLLVNRGGRAVSDTVTLTYYLSADAAVDTPDDDLAVGSHELSSGLGAGLRRVIKGIPVDLKALSPGGYHLFAVVDSTQAIAEGDEENNDSATVDMGDGPAGFIEVLVSAAAPPPDLAVMSMEDFEHHIYAGKASRVSAYGEVVNASTETAAAPSILSLWISTDDEPRVGEDDVHLDSLPFGFLAPLATGGGEFYVKTGFDPGKGGRYHLKLVVDSLREVEEADEENNIWVSSPFSFQ